MNILILSRGRHLYSTRRLLETGERFGHRLKVVDPTSLEIVLAPRELRLFEHAQPLDAIDAVIPRIGWTVSEFGVAVAEQFQLMGKLVINNAAAIVRAGDKLRCLQLLVQNGLKVPHTVMTRSPMDLDDALRRVGGPPVVLKFLQGSQGVGVMIADSRRAVLSALDAFWGLNRNVLVQEFVRESAGRDVRVFVIGGQAVAAMRRRARGEEFRSNLHRGGSGESIEVDPAMAEVAGKAAATLGLDVAGVDLLESNHGPLIVEVNASPGLEGIEDVTGVDVASHLIAHVERRFLQRSRTATARLAHAPAAPRFTV